MTPLAFGFVIYLVGLIVIALLCSRSHQNLPDFLLAGRRLGPWVVAFSERASGESGWLLLGLTGLAYASGLGDPSGLKLEPAFWTMVGGITGLSLSWYVIARPLRSQSEKYGALTMPRFFEAHLGEKSGRKSDPTLRLLATGIIAFCFTFYIAAQFVAVGKALESTFGWNQQIGVLIGAAVIVFYTLMGGFLAVAWTDFLQGWLMLIALVVLPIVAMSQLGGWGAVSDKITAIDPNLLSITGGRSPILLFSGIISGFAVGLGYMGQPHLAVRYMSMSSASDTPQARRIAIVFGCLTYGGAILMGIVAIAWFGAGAFADTEKMMPTLAQAVFPGWLAGLVICGALAAMMSTADSQLLVTSSAFTEDVYHQEIDREASDEKLVKMGRWVTLIVGLLAFGLSTQSGSSIFKKVLFAWSGLGSAFGPPLLLCLHWSRTTRNGVIAGMISGLVTVLCWDNLNANEVLSGWIPGLRLYSLVPGFLVSLLMTLAVSTLDKVPAAESPQ